MPSRDILAGANACLLYLPISSLVLNTNGNTFYTILHTAAFPSQWVLEPVSMSARRNLLHFFVCYYLYFNSYLFKYNLQIVSCLLLLL